MQNISKSNEELMWYKIIKNLKEYFETIEEIKNYNNSLEDLSKLDMKEDLEERFYDKECNIILLLKEYLNDFNIIDRLDTIKEEEEKMMLYKLILKSNAVSLNSKINFKYTKVLFIPFSFWNDKVDSDCFEQNKEYSRASEIAKIIEESIQKRILEIVENTDIKYDFNLSISEPIDIEKFIYYLEEGYDLSDYFNVPQKVYDDLIVFNNKNWLQSGVIPVFFSSDHYSSIADLDFNADEQLNNIYQDLDLLRLKFSNCYNLVDVLEKSEEIMFSLWANTILKHKLHKDAVYRESTLFVCVDEDNEPVHIKATIEDVGKEEDDILISYQREKQIDGKTDLLKTLAIWTEHGNPNNIWNVIYYQQEQEQEEENIEQQPENAFFDDSTFLKNNVTLH